jgi:hypothetical protein
MLYFAVGLLLVITLRLLLPIPLSDYQRSYFMKRELLELKHKPSLVMIGGSNVIFGFDSGMLSDSLGVPVINAGLVRGMGLKFMLDFASRYLRSGDVLMICPEYEHFFCAEAYGVDGSTEPLYWLDPLIRRDFSIRQYVGIWKGITDIPRSQLHDIFKDRSRVEVDRHHFNVYGDHDSHWSEVGKPIDVPAMSKFSEINHTFIDYYASSVSSLRSNGIEVVILPPSFAQSSYELISDRISVVRVELSVRDIDYMLDPIEFVYADSLFYDSHYHLNYAGVLDRTCRVLDYLRPFVVP